MVFDVWKDQFRNPFLRVPVGPPQIVGTTSCGRIELLSGKHPMSSTEESQASRLALGLEQAGAFHIANALFVCSFGGYLNEGTRAFAIIKGLDPSTNA